MLRLPLLLTAAFAATAVHAAPAAKLERRTHVSVPEAQMILQDAEADSYRWMKKDGSQQLRACTEWAKDAPCAMYDVLVIGGGPSGLQTAMSLGRLGRTALIVDSLDYRNNPTHHAHDIIALDGLPPKEILRKGRETLEPYTSITYRQGNVTEVKSIGDGTVFEANSTLGKIVSRKVVFATGVGDELPPINGIEKIWGTGGFWCPWCDGWEHRGGPLAVLYQNYSDDALIIRNLNAQMTIFTNGRAWDPNDTSVNIADLDMLLKAQGIQHNTTPISEVAMVDPKDINSHVVVMTSDGRAREFNGVLFGTKRPLKSRWLLDSLKIDIKGVGGLKIRLQTSAFGVFAVGDVASSSRNQANALFTGKRAGVKLVARLSIEDARIKAGLSWRY